MLRSFQTLRCSWLALPVLLAGCGGASMPAAASDSHYGVMCRKALAEHENEVKSLVYLRPDFKALKWTLGEADADGMVHEATLFEQLRQNKLHFLMIEARGGIGKTELSKALVAETCTTAPAFRIDLRDVYGQATPPAAGNAIEMALAAQLVTEGDGTLQDRIGHGRFLLAIDAIEEVPTDRRARALKDLAEVRAQHADAQIALMGRPSIFEATYGIADFDAILQIPPLDCGRARSSLARLSEDDTDRRRLNAFVTTWALDRQGLQGQQCYYPYMATYRDIQVVQRLAKTFNPDTEMGGLQATLGQVHEAILGERLQKEVADLGITPAATLQAVDAMVGLGGYADGEWNLTFGIDRCLKSQPGGDTPRTRQVCEKLFQSVLFDRIGGSQEPAKAEWRFGHQDVADLFVARWMELQLAKTPTSCELIEHHAEMIAGKTIAGYLVGNPNGARCLAQVTHAVCREGGFNKTKVGLLYKGLPLGPHRAEFVKQAKEYEAKHGAEACATKTLEAL